MNVAIALRRQIRKALFRRSRKRISRAINVYTKSYYPDFDFDCPVEGEKEHLRKWGGFLDFEIEPLYYRLYSTLSGVQSADYIPDDIYVIAVLKLLNSQGADQAFRDKNLYDLMYPEGLFPKVYLRKVQEAYLNAEYAPVANVDDYIIRLTDKVSELIVKPTLDTSSGKKVTYFKQENGGFFNHKGERLDQKYLENEYGDNFAVQEFVKQEHAVSRFNPESVNTVRIYTYRSVLSNKVHPLSFSLRVGLTGKLTDNLNSGGWGVGVSRDGRLFSRGINKYGESIEDLNGVSLKDEHVIPDFHEFIEIAKYVGSKFVYDRFLGLDVFRDRDGKIRLMEVNLSHIGTDLPHLIGTPLFGRFTDEIIAYCLENKHKLDQTYSLTI